MPTAFTIPEAQPVTPHSGVNVSEILSAIFKHKGKVLICALIGLIGATVVFFFIHANTNPRRSCSSGWYSIEIRSTRLIIRRRLPVLVRRPKT